MAFITAGAVDRPVAEATVGWMIALTHHMLAKDRLVRTGQWDERADYMGRELRDRTLGVIGLGGIARKLIELLKGWGMNPPIAFDPFANPKLAKKLGVQLVSLDELLQTGRLRLDPLPAHRADARPDRPPRDRADEAGRVSDQHRPRRHRRRRRALDALKFGTHRRRGARLLREEPVTKPNRFAELENVLLAPHSIAWTDELFRDIGRAACQGMVDLSQTKRRAAC